MTAILPAEGWWWAHVNRSRVMHLCPGTIELGSRTACGRLGLWGRWLVSTAPSGGRRCLACQAYGRGKTT